MGAIQGATQIQRRRKGRGRLQLVTAHRMHEPRGCTPALVRISLARTHAATVPAAPLAAAGLNPRAFRRRHLRLPRPMGGGEAYGPQGAPEGAAAVVGEAAAGRLGKPLVADTGAGGVGAWRSSTCPTACAPAARLCAATGTTPLWLLAAGSCILDGNLLWRYAGLPRSQQQALAAQAKARSPDQIMADLSALALATTL